MKIKFHNYTGHPVQIAAEEEGLIIDIPPETPPFEISNTEILQQVIAIDSGDDKPPVHVTIRRNKMQLKSEHGFPAPQPGVLYLVPQVIVEAVRKSNRTTTRDLIVPKESVRGLYQLSFANIVTELDLQDEDTANAANRTWKNSVTDPARYKYLHESYSSDR